MSLLYSLKAAYFRHSTQKLDDHIVDALVIMLKLKHQLLHKQTANKMFEKSKDIGTS